MSGVGLPLEGHGVPSRCKAEPSWQPEDALSRSLLHLRPAHLCRVWACLQTGLSSHAAGMFVLHLALGLFRAN